MPADNFVGINAQEQEGMTQHDVTVLACVALRGPCKCYELVGPQLRRSVSRLHASPVLNVVNWRGNGEMVTIGGDHEHAW